MLLTPEKFFVKLKQAVDREGGQAEFARAIGVTRPYINAVLQGISKPSDRVARALGYRRVVRFEKLPK